MKRLTELLMEKKSAILDAWLDVVLKSYPPDSAQFLKHRERRFSNPVGYTISEGLEAVLNGLIRKENPQDISLLLEGIIRLRAVQDLQPSQALAFVHHLKEIVRHACGANESEVYDELRTLDATIDVLSLLVFDRYMECREKIYELKANEVKNMTFRLLQRARLVTEMPGLQSESGLNS